MVSAGSCQGVGRRGRLVQQRSGLRARYYNPALGRFLTPDSIIPDVTNGQALNQYAYVYNDPINMVDPSGHFAIGGAINWAAHKGLEFLNWWVSKPDDCDCNQNPSYIVDVTQNISLGANYLAQAAWGKATTPARMVSRVVGMYKKAPVPSQYRTLANSGQRLVGIQRNVDVTGWYGGGEGYTSHLLDDFSREGSALLRSNNGEKSLYLRHMNAESPGGLTGLAGSILGAGLIDSLFQILVP